MRVLDKDFVEKEEYAELLVEEIPKKRIFETLLSVYSKWSIKKLIFFFNSILSRLSDDERVTFFYHISDELNCSNDNL